MSFRLVGGADDVSGVEPVIPDLFAIGHVYGVDCTSRVSLYTHISRLSPFCENENEAEAEA
jgi:hypothetical protein